MRVLMLGWEFPPYIAGGLGTACYGLTRALNGLGVDILFVLPKPLAAQGPHSPPPAPPPSPPHRPAAPAVSPRAANEAHSARPYPGLAPSPLADIPSHGPAASAALAVQGADQTDWVPTERLTFRALDAFLSPYLSPEQYTSLFLRQKASGQAVSSAAAVVTPSPASGSAAPAPAAFVPPSQQLQHSAFSARHAPALGPPPPANYAGNLLAETARYAQLTMTIAQAEAFDIIHAHDWMTFRAGLAAATLTRKPLIVHVHSTEFDRSPHPNPDVMEIERAGMLGADRVVAVSHFTRRILITRYGIPAEKIEVIHNAIDPPPSDSGARAIHLKKDEKIVLFMGRITHQKGPEYFLAAARKVLDHYEKVRFVIAGAGDLLPPMIELAAAMGMGPKVLFTGFLRSRDVERIYQLADLYVMPSVSEPFGLTPLEALAAGVPVIISKQSGVAEVLKHALTVDFWDTDELANKILAVLRHPPLGHTLRKHGQLELQRMSWTEAAQHVIQVYVTLTEAPAPPPAH